MKIASILGIVVLVYAGLVGAFESLLGYFQPAGQATLVITTTGSDGVAHDRVVARYETDGLLYVSANHWPRAWAPTRLDQNGPCQGCAAANKTPAHGRRAAGRERQAAHDCRTLRATAA